MYNLLKNNNRCKIVKFIFIIKLFLLIEHLIFAYNDLQIKNKIMFK